MRQQKKIRLKQLNGYSWSIIAAFICATFAMQYNAANISTKDFFQALPLIVASVFWCEKSARLTKRLESNLNKTEIFNRDLFILSFSFLLACLFSLLFSYNNSDVRGWWVFIIYFITLYGLFFSLIFSIIALLIKNHTIYTMIFSILIIVLVSFGSFLPKYTMIPLIGSSNTFILLTCSLLIIHCLFAISTRVAGLFFNARESTTHDNKLN